MGEVNMEHKQPLHTNIPRWITNIVETKKCSNCKTEVSKTSICAVGIRSIGANKSTVYVEHACPECSVRTITSFSREQSASVEELCYMLIEQIHNKRKLQRAEKIRGRVREDAIQDEEVESLVELMNSSDSFEDFLKYIGAPELSPEPTKSPEEDNESK